MNSKEKLFSIHWDRTRQAGRGCSDDKCHLRQSFRPQSGFLSIPFLKKMGQPRLLFVYFRAFQIQFYRKNVVFSGSRTQIVGVECKHADHLTTTTAQRLLPFSTAQKGKKIEVKFKSLKEDDIF